MRLVFVTPRFRASDATSPELLAAELASRAPGGWRTTVVTTTAAGASEDAFREGEIQDQGVRVVRFPVEGPSESGSAPSGAGGPGPASLTSPRLLGYLQDRSEEHDLVVLFGSSTLCLGAAKVAPGRTVLLPFAGEQPDESEVSEIFRYPAAFVFGSEAEEILILKRYQVHRRMRETVSGTLLLPRAADAAAFRKRAGLGGQYLIAAGPLEPGRGVEELLRFFSTFTDRHPDAGLGLVLIGPATLPIPERPDIRVVQPANARERVDAVGGAFLAVIPERLAAFPATAAEPFSLGIPILVNASATELTRECRASGGGLYYENYDEFELILELGLKDPSLFARMGAAGREFLESRHDWDEVLARYDRAFRSFARPSRTASAEMALGGPVSPSGESAPPSPPPEVDVAAPAPADEPRVDEAAERGEILTGPGDSDAEPGGSEPADPPEAAAEAVGPEGTLSEESDEAPEPEATPAPEAQVATDATGQDPETSEAAGAPEEEGDEEGDDALPTFFRGSIRD